MDSNWNISDDLFPNDISVYHASGSFKDLCISLSGDSPPLFYVSTHSSWSSKPSVVLHGGPIPSVSPLASAHFHSFSSAVDIALGNENHNLIKRGIFSTSLTFEVFISSTSQNEYFTWKSSWGAKVASIQGRNYGLKLVRASTGEVVAPWAKPKSSIRKKGKLRFLAPNKVDMGGRFKIMVVITILAIVEKHRRNRRNCAVAAGSGVVASGS